MFSGKTADQMAEQLRKAYPLDVAGRAIQPHNEIVYFSRKGSSLYSKKGKVKSVVRTLGDTWRIRVEIDSKRYNPDGPPYFVPTKKIVTLGMPERIVVVR